MRNVMQMIDDRCIGSNIMNIYDQSLKDQKMNKGIVRKLQRFVSCLLLFLVYSFSAQALGTGEIEISPTSSGCCPIGGVVPGELILGFQQGTTLDRVEKIAEELGTSVIKLLTISSPDPIYLMGVPVGQELAFISLFEAIPEVLHAETNNIVCIPELPPCECCPPGVICPTLPPCDLSLILSPPSGDYVTTQRFDLILIVEAPGLSVVGGSATLDGSDVTSALASCVVPGTLVSGGQTFRCPSLTVGTFGIGTHTLNVTLDLNDGSSVSDSVNWEIKRNMEP